MTKEEIIKQLVEKYKTTTEFLEGIWVKEEERGSGFGHEGEDLLKFCKKRIGIFFAKKKLTEGALHKIVITGVKITDYGNTKKYDTACKAWNSDPEEALHKGLCNEKGEPLFISGYQKGEVMRPEEFTLKTCYAIVQEIKEGDADTKWEKTFFNVPIGTQVPIHCIVENALAKGKDRHFCNDPMFVIKEKLTVEQIKQLAEEHYEKCQLEMAGEWAEKNKGKYDEVGWAIVDINDVTITKEGSKSNGMYVGDTLGEESYIIQGWVSKLPEVPVNIKQGAENVLIFHSPYGDTTNIYGIVVDEKYKKSAPTETVTPTNGDKDSPKEEKEGWKGI